MEVRLQVPKMVKRRMVAFMHGHDVAVVIDHIAARRGEDHPLVERMLIHLTIKPTGLGGMQAPDAGLCLKLGAQHFPSARWVQQNSLSVASVNPSGQHSY